MYGKSSMLLYQFFFRMASYADLERTIAMQKQQFWMFLQSYCSFSQREDCTVWRILTDKGGSNGFRVKESEKTIQRKRAEHSWTRRHTLQTTKIKSFCFSRLECLWQLVRLEIWKGATINNVSKFEKFLSRTWWIS